MTLQEQKTLYQKMLTLRNVTARALEEFDAALKAIAPPAEGQPERKRRNLKAERQLQFSTTGWKKPQELKKKAAR